MRYVFNFLEITTLGFGHTNYYGTTVRNCANAQSRNVPNVPSEIAATTVGRFDQKFPKEHKA